MKIKKIIFLLLLTAIIMIIPGPEDLHLLAGKAKGPVTIVVDAGHGRPDGGAEAVDGTQEADLNLKIAQAVKAEGEKRGIKVIMTRESEDGLYVEDSTEKKWRKLEDMKQRKKIMETTEADISISIHMNCFREDASVRGAQVFFPKTGNAEILSFSETLAESIQNKLIEGIHDGTNRRHMGKGDVYLLEDPAVPTVLVECGFLSNPEDLKCLKQQEWQRKIATSIIDGVEEFQKKKIGTEDKST